MWLKCDQKSKFWFVTDWLFRCLLVTDKFLNNIIRFGALQSALLDYWLSTKISCPADTRVCSQHSKWAKTDLGRGEGVGGRSRHTAAPQVAPSFLCGRGPSVVTHLSAPPVSLISRPRTTKAQEAAFHQPSLKHKGPGSSVPALTAVWPRAGLCLSLSLLSHVERQPLDSTTSGRWYSSSALSSRNVTSATNTSRMDHFTSSSHV